MANASVPVAPNNDERGLRPLILSLFFYSTNIHMYYVDYVYI